MSKVVTKMLVPKLRFPEFRDAGGWDEIRLIDVADKKIKWSFIGGPFGSNLKSSDYVIEGIRIIQLQNIGDGKFKGDYKIFTSEEKANELLSNNIYPNEIILSKMGDPVGRACLIPDTHTRYVMCSDGIRLVVDEELFSKYFIYTLINSIQFRGLVEKTATGSTRKRIGLDDLKKLPMIVPKPKEQQKIANCLSSLDELITAHSQKHEALKAYKKGLMQQLFPSEGETAPKLRFPEFRDTKEWVLLPIGERVDFLSGYTFQGSSMSENSSGIKLLRGINLTEGVIRHNQTIDRYYHGNIDNLEKYKVKENDLVIAMDGSKVGKNVALITPPDEGALLVQRVARLRSDCVTSIQFIFQLINSLRFQAYVEKVNTSSGIPHISAKQINGFQVYFPIPSEQQKIADCLSSLDELITAQTKKIESLKAHKKGLMQQLFPVVDDDGMDAEGRAMKDGKAEVKA